MNSDILIIAMWDGSLFTGCMMLCIIKDNQR